MDVTGLTMTGISFAHPATSSDDRARLALEGDRLTGALGRLHQNGIDGFIMSTCLRVELTVLGCDEVLGRAMEAAFPEVELPDTGEVRRGKDLVHHLFRVAAGVDSPIVGEPEVLSQFRAAVDAAKHVGTAGGVFAKILETSISVGRQARKMLPTTPAGSIALVAAELAGGPGRLAVFGAGAMAKAAVNEVRRSHPDTRVTVYARRPEAVHIPDIAVAHLADAPHALVDFPVVISATAAKRELFAPEVLDDALSRRVEPLLLLDLAMPPDFVPSNTNGVLTYRNIDDLAEHVRRHPVSAEVDSAVAQEAEGLWARLSLNSAIGPVVSGILDHARRAVEEEVDRFVTKLDNPDGNEAVLKQLAQTVAHRVLHPALSYLGSAEGGPQSIATLAEAFGVRIDD